MRPDCASSQAVRCWTLRLRVGFPGQPTRNRGGAGRCRGVRASIRWHVMCGAKGETGRAWSFGASAPGEHSDEDAEIPRMRPHGLLASSPAPVRALRRLSPRSRWGSRPHRSRPPARRRPTIRLSGCSYGCAAPIATIRRRTRRLRRTKAEWQDQLLRMIEKGAIGEEKEIETVFGYLLRNHGRTASTARRLMRSRPSWVFGRGRGRHRRVPQRERSVCGLRGGEEGSGHRRQEARRAQGRDRVLTVPGELGRERVDGDGRTGQKA